jgi:CubicO group peptidase (beta-lactamase class C family)
VIRKSAVAIALALSSAALTQLALPRTAEAQEPGEISYHDESALPEGIIGERIASMIETFNSGDPDRVRAFLENECTARFRDFAPMEDHLEVFASVRRQWGEVEFHSIRTYRPPRPDETIVILKDQNFGAWRAFSFRFDEAADYRVAGFGFNDARTPSNVDAPPALVASGLVEEATELVERACERDVFSGTVLLAHGEEVLLTHACGEASKRFHVANNLDTRFNLGSMNKMFTATAIMQLVEKGMVSVDDPISEYVDESWLPREMTDRITVHHLLTHTSGLGSYFNETYFNSSRELFRALDDYKPLVRDEQLAFEPGSSYRYSNTGMFLLGVVIESATGETYFDYIRDHIYAPAGMASSDSYEMDEPVENLAIGYGPAPGWPYGFENNLYKHVIMGGPAGGGFSTVGDLHRFALALQSGGLVSEESLERMWTDHSGEGYGYGFGIQDGPNGVVVGHGGGFPGINSNLDIMIDRGYIVAVMSNYGGAASPIARAIAGMIARVPAGSD